MKNVNLLLFLCLFSFSIQAQSIFDKDVSIHLLNMISVQDSVYSFAISGTCSDGGLYSGVDQPTNITGYGFTSHAVLKQNNDKWITLTTNRSGDDIDDDHVRVAYIDDSGEVVQHTLERINYFNDFALTSDGSIVVPTAADTLMIFDREGRYIDFWMNTQIVSVESFNDAIVGFNDDTVVKFNEYGSIQASLDFEKAIKSYSINDGALVIAFDDMIEWYDENLMLTRSVDISFDGEIKDLNVSGPNTHILITEDDQSILYEIDAEGNIITVYEEGREELDYHGILWHDGAVFIYGHQTMGGYQKNGIIKSVSPIVEEKSNVSIEMGDIREMKDTFNIFEQPDGVTLYEISYSYEFDYSISNLSDSKVDEILVFSNRKHGVNCAYARYFERFEDLDLEAGETMTIEVLFDPYRQYETICLYAAAVDGRVDVDIFDNSTCRMVLSNRDIEKQIDIKLYPNPTTSTLSIESDHDLSSATILNMTGQKMANYNIEEDSTIDLTGLPQGVYLIRLVDRLGQSTTSRFTKL